MGDIVERERALLASCLKRGWHLSAAYVLFILFYTQVVYSTQPVRLAALDATYPEWMLPVFFRPIIGFSAVLSFSHLSPLLGKR